VSLVIDASTGGATSPPLTDALQTGFRLARPNSDVPSATRRSSPVLTCRGWTGRVGRWRAACSGSSSGREPSGAKVDPGSGCSGRICSRRAGARHSEWHILDSLEWTKTESDDSVPEPRTILAKPSPPVATGV